ncbi:MAG: MarC family protein [Chloroflexi bacterium]|nr:MarC family protein [Chloroflexota bacterium]
MHSWSDSFIFTFVPLFIVIDAIGNLPFVISASEGMLKPERRKMINIVVITAAVVGLIFLFLGQLILNVMDISFGSFAIAGGLILLALSVRYMITGQMVESSKEAKKEEMVGVVPIGTPLTVGPATITTLLLLVKQYPLYWVLISFALNLFIVWIVCMLGNWIARFLGQGGIKAVSRVFSLLLAAIAVSMVIKGLEILGVLHLTT